MLSWVFSVNQLVAIFLAAAAELTLGFFWYSPNVFGRPWQKLSGLSAKKANSSRLLSYLFPLFSALATAAFMLPILLVFGVNHTLDGAVLGAFLGAGFVLTSGATLDFFARRPLGLFLINYGYQLLGLMLIGAVLGAWLE